MFKRKEKIFAILLLIGVLWWGVKLVKAAEESTVTATVTAQSLSVSVADASISYGSLGVGASATTAINDGDSLTDSQDAVNIGNISEKINIRGLDSAAWTLGTNPASEIYSHDFCTSSCDASPSWAYMTTSNQTLVASIGIGATQNFDLRIRMPSSTSTYTSQTVSATVQATTP